MKVSFLFIPAAVSGQRRTDTEPWGVNVMSQNSRLYSKYSTLSLLLTPILLTAQDWTLQLDTTRGLYKPKRILASETKWSRPHPGVQVPFDS